MWVVGARILMPLCHRVSLKSGVRERFPHRRARNPLSSGGPSTGRPAASVGRPPPGPGGVFPEPESPLCSGEELKPIVRTGERGRKGFPDILHGMSTKHHRRPVEGPVRKGQGFGNACIHFTRSDFRSAGRVNPRTRGRSFGRCERGMFLVPHPISRTGGPSRNGDGPADDRTISGSACGSRHNPCRSGIKSSLLPFLSERLAVKRNVGPGCPRCRFSAHLGRMPFFSSVKKDGTSYPADGEPAHSGKSDPFEYAAFDEDFSIQHTSPIFPKI